MRAGVTVNGRDLGDFGWVSTRPAGLLDAAPRALQTALATGAVAHTALATLPTLSPRELVLTGYLAATSAAALQAGRDGLTRWLADGLLDVASDFDPTRGYRGYWLGGVISTPNGGFWERFAETEIHILCPDSRAWASTDTVVALSAAAAACPLGSAPSDPVITIAGTCTNPTGILKNAAGATLETMSFALALGVADTLVINVATRTAIKTIGGVASSAIGDCTTHGQFPTFLRLDPRDGSQVGGTWPSLSVTVASGAPAIDATYRKRFW